MAVGAVLGTASWFVLESLTYSPGEKQSLRGVPVCAAFGALFTLMTWRAICAVADRRGGS
jgi:hypothetical protein